MSCACIALAFDLCDNVTVSLTGVKAVAVDSFEQPLEREDAVSGSLVFRQAKQGGLEAAQMVRLCQAVGTSVAGRASLFNGAIVLCRAGHERCHG